MEKNRGFTLIELMIVVAIVGALAAIAISNYNEYITRSRIISATSSLSDMRVKMEQYFQDNRTYLSVNASCPPGVVPPPTNYFAFDCGAPTATAYTLTADGDGVGASRMTGFKFTVDQSNAKTSTISAVSGKASTGWGGNGSACWVMSKSGGC